MAGTDDPALLSDVARIRQVLARELETINEYEAFAQASSQPEVRAFFLHLAAEEKEHVAEAVHMLRMMDAAQEEHFARPVAAGHFQGAVAAPTAPATTPSEPASEPLSLKSPHSVLYSVPAAPSTGALPLTVGSLRRSR